MPRYFVDTFDGIAAIDEDGLELSGLDEVLSLVRRTLAQMMADEKDVRPALQLRADVRDASGQRLMTASLCMIIDEDT